MRHRSGSAFALLALALAIPPMPAARAGDAPAAADDKPYGALAWRLVGPSIGGRITRVAGVAGDPQVF